MLFVRPSSRYDTWQYFGQFLVKLARVLFIVSSITFVIYFWLENLKIGLISNYFDLNILILISLVSLMILLVDPLFARVEVVTKGSLSQWLVKFLLVASAGILVKLSFPGTSSTIASLLIMLVITLLIYNLNQD